MKNITLIILVTLFVNISSIFAIPPTWSVNSNDFQYSMSMTGAISLNGLESVDANDIVGAFVGSECRGVASPVFISSINRYFVFILVYSNSISSEEITFKVYDNSTDSEIPIGLAQTFTSDLQVGTINEPYVWASPSFSSETQVLSFELAQQAVPTTIDATNHTIQLQVAAQTSLTGLIPTFTLSAGATVNVSGAVQTSGTSAQDFTNLVTYSVMAENGVTSQDWLVQITAFAEGDDNQTLSLTNDILTIENGNSVNLAEYADNQNLQAAYLSGTILNVLIEGGTSVSVDLSPLFIAFDDRITALELLHSNPVASNKSLGAAMIAQNSPNPYKQSTSINYYIPETVNLASMVITDLNGRVLKELPIKKRGNNNIIIDSLPNGTYLYCLSLDDKKLKPKVMVKMD